MTRRSFNARRAVLPVLLFVASFAPICNEPAAPPDAGSGPDGGAPPADLSGGGTSDGPPPGGEVEVTVRREGKPAANARVIFHDADGAVLQDLRTDGSGVVRGGGRQVTLVDPEQIGQGARVALLTYSDVEAGDRLLFDTPVPEDDQTPSGTVLVSVDPVPGGSRGIDAYVGGCRGNGLEEDAPFEVPLVPVCRGTGGKGAVHVVAHGIPNVPMGILVSGLADFDLPAPGGTKGVLVGAWHQANKFTTVVMGLGNNYKGGALVDLFRLGTRYGTEASQGAPGREGGQIDWMAWGFTEYRVHASHSTRWDADTSHAVHYGVRKELPGGPGTGFNFDWSVAFLAADGTPWIDTVEASLAAPGRPEIRWTTLDGPGAAAPRAAYPAVSWPSPPRGAVKDRWMFVVDPGRKSVVAPQLPADLTTPDVPGHAPGPSAQLVPEVTLARTTRAGSFKEMKALATDGWLDGIADPYSTPLGAEATWSTTALPRALTAAGWSCGTFVSP